MVLWVHCEERNQLSLKFYHSCCIVRAASQEGFLSRICHQFCVYIALALLYLRQKKYIKQSLKIEREKKYNC